MTLWTQRNFKVALLQGIEITVLASDNAKKMSEKRVEKENTDEWGPLSILSFFGLFWAILDYLYV